MKNQKKNVRVRSKKLSLNTSKTHKSDYDKDFFKWTKTQAKLLEKGEFEKLDTANLKEEIESLGRSDKRAVRSHLANLIAHLLKQLLQNKSIKSWNDSVENARLEISFIMEDSPSLKRQLPELLKQAYGLAVIRAAQETRIPEEKFPTECPWKLEEILNG